MRYIKCTRCELNYHTEDEEFCFVCTRQLSGGEENDCDDDEVEGDICPFCDENALPYGEEMCARCALIHNARNGDEAPPPMKNKINFIEVDK